MGNRTVAVRFVGDTANLDGALGSIGARMSTVSTLAIGAGAAIGAAFVGAGAALFSIGSSFDSAFDAIRVGTGETGAALDGLEDSFRDVVRNVPTDFDSASEAIAGLNQRLDLTGRPLEDLSTQLLNLSRITETDVASNVEGATDLFNNWGVATENQSTLLDELFRASQQSGVGVGELMTQLAANGTVLREVGFSVEEGAALLASLGRAGVDAADVMPALQRTMAAAAQEGRSASEVFAETFDRIRNAPNDTEAAAAALDVFGSRAGPRLAAMIREGRLSYEEMLGSITAGGDTINAAAADTADFGEKWQVIKNRVLLALEPVATRVFDSVGQAMDRLGPIVDVVIAKVQQFLPVIEQRVAPVVEVVQRIFTAVVSWFQQAGDASDGLGSRVSALGELLSSAFAAIEAIFQTFVAIVQDLWARFGDDLVQFAVATWQNVQQVFDGAVQFLTGVFDLIKAILTGKWGEAWEAVKQIVAGAWAAVNGLIDQAFAALRAALEVGLGAISAVWSFAWNAFKTLASDALDGVVGFVTGLPGRIGSAVAGAFDAIPHAFRSAINALIDLWNDFHIEFGGYDIPGPGPNIPGFRIDTPNIPHLASGGVLTRPTLVVAGDAPSPEIVTPEDLMRRIVREEGGGGGGFDDSEMVGRLDTLIDLLAELVANTTGRATAQRVRLAGMGGRSSIAQIRARS